MKERISITIDKDLLQWIDDQIASKRFATRSHALEFLVNQRMKSTLPLHYIEGPQSQR